MRISIDAKRALASGAIATRGGHFTIVKVMLWRTIYQVVRCNIPT